jgi:hypothetical protein
VDCPILILTKHTSDAILLAKMVSQLSFTPLLTKNGTIVEVMQHLEMCVMTSLMFPVVGKSRWMRLISALSSVMSSFYEKAVIIVPLSVSVI